MQGDLAETPLPDVCRELARESASGRLVVMSAAGQGTLSFRRGRIVHADSPTRTARIGDRLVHAGLLTRVSLDKVLARQPEEPEKLGKLLVDEGLVDAEAVRVFVQEQWLEALVDLVSWRRGTYVFTATAVAPDGGVPADLATDRALAEAERRAADWRQVQRVLPDASMVVARSSEVDLPTHLEPDERAVLEAVTGGRSVRRIAQHLGYAEREAASIVYGLRLLGLVELGPPSRDENDEEDETASSASFYAVSRASDDTDREEPDVWVAEIDDEEEVAPSGLADETDETRTERRDRRRRFFGRD